MIKEKTAGNLSKKENEMLGDSLANLQLTYADEKKKDAEEEKQKTGKEPKEEKAEQPAEEKKEEK
jgi:hypothetical protein